MLCILQMASSVEESSEKRQIKTFDKKDHTMEETVNLLQSLTQGEDEDPQNFFVRVQHVLDAIGAKEFNFNAWSCLFLLLGLTESALSFFDLKGSKVGELLHTSIENLIAKEEPIKDDCRSLNNEELDGETVIEQELEKVFEMNLQQDLGSLSLREKSGLPRVAIYSGITFFICAICEKCLPPKTLL